jgi:hypothetical protein
LTNVLGEDSSIPPPEKYIITEMNMTKNVTSIENSSPKEKIAFIKKALRRAPSKLFGIFKVYELSISP